MPRLRPFFSYYGSKWRLAPQYPEPRYDTIIEPFAGSAGYSLLYPDRDIILVERDPIIAGLWRWLITADPDEILSLPVLKCGESLDDYEMSQEARWLMGFWIHTVGAMPSKTVTKSAAFTGSGRDQLGMWPKRVVYQLSYIRHWRVLNGSYDSAPDVTATWFVDPPYQVAGKHYRYGSGKLDYAKLGEWCRGRNGQVIACENDGADWLPFEMFTEQQGMTNNGKVRYSKEVIWTKD